MCDIWGVQTDADILLTHNQFQKTESMQTTGNNMFHKVNPTNHYFPSGKSLTLV